AKMKENLKTFKIRWIEMEQLFKKFFTDIGITINGNQPYDIQIHDDRTFSKVLKSQSIGAGESYMDKWWDCEQLDELFFRICRQQAYNIINSRIKDSFISLKNSFINQQTRTKAEQVANRHYNLGNKFYERMLGNSMAYTCGYWQKAKNINEAQFAKYELIC